MYGLEPGRKYQAVIRLRNSNPLPSSNNPIVKFQTDPMKILTEDMDKYQWIALVLGCIAILCLIGFSVFVYKFVIIKFRVWVYYVKRYTFSYLGLQLNMKESKKIDKNDLKKYKSFKLFFNNVIFYQIYN